VAKVLAVLLIACCCAAGQARPRFWTRKNIILHSMNLAVQTVDMVYTRYGIDDLHAREADPVARCFVDHGWAGSVALSYGLNVGGPALISYALHRRRHERLEGLPPIALSVGGIAATISNTIQVQRSGGAR